MREGFLTGSPLTWRALAGPGRKVQVLPVIDTHDGFRRKKRRDERKPEPVAFEAAKPALAEPKKPTLETYVPDAGEFTELVASKTREVARMQADAERLRRARDEDEAAALLLLL